MGSMDFINVYLDIANHDIFKLYAMLLIPRGEIL